MAVQGVAAVRLRPRLGDVGADVGAALLLGHAHAAQRAALLAHRPEAGVVRRGGQQRRPLLGQRVVDAERRDRGVGHRDRAAVAGLGVRPGQEPGRAAQVRVGIAVGLPLPRRRGQPVADRALHQPVPGRVELDLVDPVAVAVVRRQLGVVLVGEPALLAGLGGAGLGAQRQQPLEHLGRAVAHDGLAQREVGGDDVVADQRRHLVGGRPHGCAIGSPHGPTVEPMVAEPVPPSGRAPPRRDRSSRRVVAPRPRHAVAAGRHHRQLLPALPGHRPRRRGGVLRRALGAAAALRPRRRHRLRHQPVRPRPGRPDAGRRHRLLRAAAHRAGGQQGHRADPGRRPEGRPVRHHLARLRAGAVVGEPGAQRLHRHHHRHARPRRPPRDHQDPGAVVRALRAGGGHRRRRDPADAGRPAAGRRRAAAPVRLPAVASTGRRSA